ncbi:nociceptin receptor-like [Glandiceps talaboti]
MSSFHGNSSNSSNSSSSADPKCSFADQEVIFIVYAIACTIAILANLAFLVVVIKVKTMRTMPNFFFINLSMADILFMVYYLAYLLALKFNITPLLTFHQKGGHSITDVAFIVSMLTVALISLNRYIAICHPFKAEKIRLQSTSRIASSIAFCWIVGLSLAVFDTVIYTSEMQETLFIVLVFLLALCIVISFCVVFVSYVLIARRVLYTKRKYSHSVDGTTSCISEENQILLLTVGITVVFFLSCSPMATVYVLVPFSGVGYTALERSKLFCLSFIAKITISLHFTLNPILYNIGSKNHRTAFCKVWGLFRNRRESTQVEYV